jgi:hypothetical protein
MPLNTENSIAPLPRPAPSPSYLTAVCGARVAARGARTARLLRRFARCFAAARREFRANEQKPPQFSPIAHGPLAVANRGWHFRFVCSVLQIKYEEYGFRTFPFRRGFAQH